MRSTTWLLTLLFIVAGCDERTRPRDGTPMNDGGAPMSDGGGPETDGGGPGTDGGGPMNDGGGPETDGGGPMTGDGGPITDDGGPMTDAGRTTSCMTPGARRCGAANAVELCNAAGMWEFEESCPFSCSMGMCEASVTCMPGQSRCTGNVAEICNATGSAFLYLATCPVGCAAGLCTGTCNPGERRCNGNAVEECAMDGSGFASVETCTLACDAPTRTCVLNGLEIAMDATLEGDVVVDGAFILRSGATLRSQTGDLTIRADSITVELGATIVADATSTSPRGSRGRSSTSSCAVSGGGGGTVPPESGTTTDAVIGQGGAGSDGGRWTRSPDAQGGNGGNGGGTVRLLASGRITIAGEVRADGESGTVALGRQAGGGGGGSGGGILVVAPTLDVTGTLSAQGGAGGGGTTTCNPSNGRAGAEGFVKTFSDSEGMVMGTINARHVRGIRPPLTITSSTHPDPGLIYNDDFDTVALTWSQPFAVQGYFWSMTTGRTDVPTSATGTFAPAELTSVDRDDLRTGSNFFHIVPIDAMSLPGTIQNYFEIQVNSQPPTAESTSHTREDTWYPNRNPFFSWTLPNPRANHRGYYYVLDQYGDTVPDESDIWLDISQEQILLANVPPGVHMFHVISVDQQGYRTRAASHVRVNVGPDPGSGTVFGRVRAVGGMDLRGAAVTINRGLLRATNPDARTLANGAYNMMDIPAGAWEVTASAEGYRDQTQMVTVGASGMVAADFSLMPE